MPVLGLAGIRRRAEIHVHRSLGADEERMHGMVAGQRQSRNDGFARTTRHDRAGGQRVARDAVIDLRVDRAFVHADACPARAAALHGFAKALGHIGFSRTVFILQGDEETSRVRSVVAVVPARPGIDVDHSARRHNHVAGVADIVGEDGCTEPGGNVNPLSSPGRDLARVSARVPDCLGSRIRRDSCQQHAEQREKTQGKCASLIESHRILHVAA